MLRKQILMFKTILAIFLMFLSQNAFGDASYTPEIEVKQNGTSQGYAQIANCTTGMTCTASGGTWTLSSSGSGTSQWTGTNPIYFNGNVGISSTTPGQALDVLGTVRATNFIGSASGLTGSTFLRSANNLSDLTNQTLAQTNLLQSVYTTTDAIAYWGGPGAGFKTDTAITTDESGALITTSLTTGAIAASGTIVETNTATHALAVGRQGQTNPAFEVNTASASGVTGLKITANTSGSGASLDTTSSGSNENLNITSKGTGIISLNGASTSNIGLGTFFPQNKLDVTGSDSGTTTTNSSAAMIVVTNTNTTNNNFEDLSFSSANSSGANIVGAKIAGVNTSHTAGSESMDMAFFTRSIGVGAEKVRILANGNVGIGSINPGQKLDVQGTLRALFFKGDGSQLTNLPAGSGTVNSGVIQELAYYPASAAAVSSSTGITLANNVGIGVIKSGTEIVPLNNFDANDGIVIGSGYAGVKTAPTGGLLVLGNIGIGSATPGQALDINGTLRITNTGTASNPSLLLDTAGTTGFWVPATSAIALSAGGSERVRFLSSGNVAIGSTVAANTLVIGGGINATGTSAFIATSSSPVIGSNNNTSSAGAVFTGGSGAASFSRYKTTASGSPTTDAHVFYIGNLALEAMRIQDTNQGATGFNIGIGTSVPRQQLEVDGTLAPNFPFTFTAQGNVGIGSVNPGKALDVNGTMRLIGSGHIISTGTAPTVANNDCGTTSQGTVSAGSTDFKGSFTVGTLTVTSCAVTFAGTFGTAPTCFTQDDTNILGVKTTTTTTKMTTTSTTSMSGDVVNYICVE